MTAITFLPAKENSKMRRYKRNREYYKQRNELKAKQKSRSVEEIWDSIFKPVDETDVLASLIIGIKDMPDVQHKQPRLRKPIMSDSSVTARG
ncbi:hypothetical protein GKR59_15720 [Providencia alcalifaciens]|uniref:hypothetical protein n=1 Tax=Providencia TaxID=586 RepID=UPI0012B58643|nr:MULTISPECIES: hypothetical protein [Providencia]MTC51072.1 hypothetical protein [Providencia alcalifaciens]